MRLYFPDLSPRAFAIWRRNFLVWRKLALPSLLGNLADPMIYLFGLGYGLGGLLPQVGGVSYIAFLAAGTVCASTMNAASFEALYSGFSRMHVQRTWEAIMNAPVSLDDVLAGECLWAAAKASLSGVAILAVIGVLGYVDGPLALWALPAIFEAPTRTSPERPVQRQPVSRPRLRTPTTSSPDGLKAMSESAVPSGR